MDTPCNYIFTMLYLSIAAGSPCLAQSFPNGWINVVDIQQINTKIKVRLDNDPKGIILQFKSNSNETIHFNFGFQGVQNQPEQINNGRIHLKNQRTSGKILVEIPNSLRPTANINALRIYYVRSGAIDKGNFLNL